MDPEVIAQLEQQLRELTEMLANQNSTMKSQMEAMNRVAGTASGAASATKKNTETSTQATTKYAEAQEKAAEASGKSEVASKALAAGMGTLSASVSGLVGTFGSLGSSLLSAEQGLAKYGKVADNAASAAEGIAKSIPIVGGALGGLVGVIGKVAAQILTDGLKLVDTFVNLRDGLVQVGGALPVTGEQLIKLANNAGYFGERMQVLGKITQGLGTSLATLDTTAGRGATKFMEIANVTDDLRRQYGRLGISQERLTEMQGMYIKSQEASGLSMQNQTKTAAQLRKESLAYVDNMTRLSALTGKQAEQLQAEQDLVAATIQERMEVVKENAQIKQLRSEGREAEAREIERQQKDRDLFRKQLTADLGPEAATMAMKVIRSGVYDNVSAPLANLGIDFVKYGQMIKEGGIDASKAARSLTTEYDKGVEKIGTSLGAATEFLNDDQYKTLGVVGEAVGRGLTRAGKNYEDANTQAEKDIADRKKAGDDLADMVEQVRSQERQFQAMYQKFLLDKIMKLSSILKDFDLFGLVTKNFTDILKTIGAGMAIAAGASAALGAALAALKLRQYRANQQAIKAQQEFTKSLNASTLAMKEQARASKTAAGADRSEASASRTASAADRSEALASKRAAAADKLEERASRQSAQASQKSAAASQRAAAASQRAAAASQRAAAADMREAAASMKAAAADLREAKASDAAAAADRREAMSGGGGDFGGGGGRGKGKGLGKAARWGGRLARGVAGGIGGLLGGMALDYGAEKAEEAGHTKTSGALSVGSSAVTGAGLGATVGSVVPVLGTGVGAAIGGVLGGLYGVWENRDKLFGGSTEEAAKQASEALGTTASPMVVDFANPMALDQASIDQMGLSEPELTKAMRTGQLDGNTALIASIEDAKQQLQGSTVKSEEDAAKTEEERAKTAEQAQKYTIKQGDTLSELAEKFGTTVEALLEANPDIKNKDLIYAGASLNVPGQQYTVQQGDTMQNIAKQFGISEEELKKANPNLVGMKKKDWKAGIKLNIPGKQQSQEEMQKQLEAMYGPEYASKVMELMGSGSEFMNPEKLAQLGISGGLTTLPGLPGQGGNLSTLPGLPGQGGNLSTLPGVIPPGGLGMFDSEQMEEMYGSLNARNRETATLLEDQKSATDRLLGSTTTYDKTLDATNKSLLLFRDLLDALNQVLSPSAARSGQASSLMGGGSTPTMPTDNSGPSDPSFSSSSSTSTGTQGSQSTGAPSAMGAMPNFGGGMMGAGMMPGLMGMPNGMMGMPPTGFDGNMGRILATIRARESRGDYSLPGPKGMPGTASGAYAFIDSSWRGLTKKYGIGTEYARAFMAPPAIQDQVAARYVQEILQQAGGDVSKVPLAWYTGNIHGNISAKAMAINGGLTPQAYQQKWMATYMGQSDVPMMGGGGMPMMGMPMMGMMGGMQGDGGLISNLAMMSNMMSMMGGGMMGPGMMGPGMMGPGMMGPGMMGPGMMNPYFGGGMASGADPNIVQLGKMLQSQGLRVSENPAFGGVEPVHKGRGHYEGRAIDVNVGHGNKEAYDPVHGPRFDQLAAQLRQAGYTVIWRSPGHYDHMHIETKKMPMAEKGGVFKGPDSGYLAMLHGKEAVIPLDNKFTRTQSSESYTVNGKPASKKEYDSFMKSHPELQNIQNKVQSMLGSLSDKSMDPSRVIGSVSKLMDSNLTGVKDEIIDKNERIQESLLQVVNSETKKAIQAVTEANQPLQMISNEISTNMRKVMSAHNQTMSELTYKLGEMIDALNTSNDHTKKILKKAST